MKRTFARRRPANGPTRVWASLTAQFVLTNATATTAVPLLQLQAPADLSNLTADPPEDLTILRVVGTFSAVTSAAVQRWELAMLVQDVTWTPGASFAVDADKRMLWTTTLQAATAAVHSWSASDYLGVGTALTYAGGTTKVDFSPKVKVEAGKALYLVAYEETAGDLTVASTRMRVLFQRSGRRSR